MSNLKAITNVRLFDGKELSDKTTVYVDGDRFAEEVEGVQVIDAKGAFMMPGLIDGHCHVTQKRNVRAGLKYGVTTAMSIRSSDDMRRSSRARIYSTYDRALGSVNDPKEFVDTEIANGADYIKVIIEHKPMMDKTIIKEDVVKGIVEEAHKRGKLVACHAVSVPTLEMAIEAGVDIYVHVPLEAVMTADMVDRIAAQGAPVVPTLSMMMGFANGPIYGYKKSDYKNSEDCVRLLHEAGVPLMVGTDANNVIFLPWVKFGRDMHREMNLMAGAGLQPLELLRGATSIVADGYGLKDVGSIEPGKYADFLLIDGDPSRDIRDMSRIKAVYIGGEAVYSE